MIWHLISSYATFQRPYRAPRYRSLEDVPLKVFIVEEHEEVIPYWSDAFIQRAFPPNSTIIHIDAHPDDGLPSFEPMFPFFRPPRSELQVASMVQANDRFIRAAQITHMLSRLVWIYPFWAQEVQESYVDTQVDIGFTVFRGKKAPCECSRDNGAYKCFVLNDEGGPEPLTNIPVRLCEIQRRVRSEVTRDIYAVTRLPTDPSWLAEDHLVLDIDLDFFGVRLVGRDLLASGIAWTDVTHISSCIGEMLCPNDPSDEAIADRWFFGLISSLLTKCHGAKVMPPWCNNNKAAVQRFFLPFRSDARSQKMFCAKEKSTKVDLVAKRCFMKIWTILGRLTSKQLTEVRRAGICLVQSMRSMAPPQFHLCLGHNTPNDSAVKEHYPTAAELFQQFGRLRSILVALPSRPRLVTLARSSRDGYVPRDLQADVERSVIQILLDVYKLTEEDLVYDELLLNGRQGDWFRRRY